MKTKKTLLYLILAASSFQVTNNIFSECIGGCGESDEKCVKAHVCEECKTPLREGFKGNDKECSNKKYCCKKGCSGCKTKKNNCIECEGKKGKCDKCQCWAQTKEKDNKKKNGKKKDDKEKDGKKQNKGRHGNKDNGKAKKMKKTDSSK